MNLPQVSVVIPVRNGSDYLGAAIESALAQRDVELEVIVVDDGSRDTSREIARSYDQVVLLEQEHRGVGAARNFGWSLARGPHIAYLDADDLWSPTKLAAQLSLLEEDARLDAAGAYVEEFVSEDVVGEQRARLVARPGRHTPPIPSALLLRRETLDRLGPFSESREAGAALDFTLRMHEAGLRWKAADGAIVYRRIHLNNRTRVARSVQQQEYLAAIKRSLDRRRDDGGSDSAAGGDREEA